VRIRETEVYTHAGKARAMRAPGFPQVAWALEQAMDALAEKVRVDPVELRLRNLNAAVQWTRPVPYSSMGLDRCLTEGARAFGWKEARQRPRPSGPVLRGVGVAACLWPAAGGPPATAILELLADGSLKLTTGVSDIGTGAKTVLAMTASEELGVPLDRIQVEWADTATTPYAQVSGGSRTVINNTPAVREAAAEIRRQLLEIAAEELKRPSSELLLKDGHVVPVDAPGKGLPISQLRGLQERQVILAVGSRHPNPPKLGLPFAAHFAEVEVDTRTGEVRLTRFLAAHDSGRVMNRLTYENQVKGGVTMGIGFALTESRVLDRQTGRVLNANLHDYKVPTAADVPPDMSCLPIDPHDTECNTTGTKGLGEPATVPTAPAIANAVYHATGIRVTRAPITPMQVLERLATRRSRAPRP
jgi:xanthine dehydrogenase YagR molybdenum-binding subunit